MADATPKPYSVPAGGSVSLDGPIYGLRVTAPQRLAYVKVNDGIDVPLTSFSHYDLDAQNAWQRIKLVNPSTLDGELKVEVQYAAGVPFNSPVEQPLTTNNSGQAMVQILGLNSNQGTSLSTTVRAVGTDDWGKLLVGEGEHELLYSVTDWAGHFANGTHYLTEDGASATPQILELSPYYSGVRLEIYNGIATGGVGPTIAFYVDELDADGNVLKEHPAGSVNNFGNAPTGGYIHLRHGAEERATDSYTRRVAVRPRRVRFRYVTASVTSLAAKARVIGLR